MAISFLGPPITDISVIFLQKKKSKFCSLFLANLNDTLITLIPKCDNLESMHDLCPIALCNVLYKVIAKVLANRLKVILLNIISNTQFALVLDWSILDNVIVVVTPQNSGVR